MPRATTITLYVDAAVSSSGNGLTWGTAYKTITEAVTRLRLYSVIRGSAVVNIKTGTYAEYMDVAGIVCNNIAFIPDSGDVTLTGYKDYSGWQVSGLFQYVPGLLTLGGTYKIIAAPSTMTLAYSSYFWFQHCTDVWCNLYGDGNAYKATCNVNGITSYYSNLFIGGGTMSNFDSGISTFGSTVRANTLAGTGNTYGPYLQGSTMLIKGTNYTLAGTVYKADGCFIINADGTHV